MIDFGHFPEYLNPNTTARIKMALIKHTMHFLAYLLLAHSSALLKCSFPFWICVNVSSILKSILSINEP